MEKDAASPRKAVIVRPEEGRTYDMGRMQSTFFVDGEEGGGRYSISEWWLEPRTEGPGAHEHPEDHIFYVIAGTVSLILEGERNDLGRGSYAVIPGGVNHDFENRGQTPCGFISINVPAGFEKMMPHLVAWFASKPLGDVQGP